MTNVIRATGLFPPDILRDMIMPFLDDQDPQHLWLTCRDGDHICGVSYSRQEELAEGTWNMLALGVDPAMQRQGYGAGPVTQTETALRDSGARILIVETSGTPDFDAARAFYARMGYDPEARIRDYWAAGDDKVTFRKAL